MSNNVRGRDVSSRWGGNEFIILALNIESKDHAEVFMNRIGTKINHQLSSIDNIDKVNIGVSIGMSIYPDDGKDFEKLLKVADKTNV